MEAPVTRKLVGETEGAGGDLHFNSSEVRTGSIEVPLVWNQRQRGSKKLAIDGEIKLNTSRTGGQHTEVVSVFRAGCK